MFVMKRKHSSEKTISLLTLNSPVSLWRNLLQKCISWDTLSYTMIKKIILNSRWLNKINIFLWLIPYVHDRSASLCSTCRPLKADQGPTNLQMLHRKHIAALIRKKRETGKLHIDFLLPQSEYHFCSHFIGQN